MTGTAEISVADSAIARIASLREKQGKPGLMLRVTVDGGGCSGFQYKLALTDAAEPDDIRFNEAIVTDPVSLDFLKGSQIRFEDTLLGAEFRIDNPNAKSGCGCGASFSV